MATIHFINQVIWNNCQILDENNLITKVKKQNGDIVFIDNNRIKKITY